LTAVTTGSISTLYLLHVLFCGSNFVTLGLQITIIMKKILFPTDFSEASINAFIYALKLADNIGAEVVTLHVYELPVVDSNFINVPLYQVEVYQSLELNSFENYKDQIPVLHQIAEDNHMQHIPISNVLVQGELLQNILEIVKEQRFDYIVMGTKGASGVKETFFGTTTASIMTSTDACVLGIPEDLKYRPIKKIGFTTQFHDDDQQALKRVVSVAQGFGATVECLYVKTPGKEINDARIANWNLLFERDNVIFHIVESTDVEGSVINFIENSDLDMLALLNHRRGFWDKLFHSSLTRKLAFHIKIPLLVLHD
jgi:nucleotide-binding universal stress UspA family protein